MVSYNSTTNLNPREISYFLLSSKMYTRNDIYVPFQLLVQPFVCHNNSHPSCHATKLPVTHVKIKTVIQIKGHNQVLPENKGDQLQGEIAGNRHL